MAPNRTEMTHASTPARNPATNDKQPGSGIRSVPRRRMVRAELLGQHSHQTADGQSVHVWVRDQKYLARGRHRGRAFGQYLGADIRDAAAALRRLLVQIEDATFQPPSEARKRVLKAGSVPRNNVRQLCDAFLVEKRKLRGQKTADDYRNRLAPLVEFSEQPDVLRRWPLAADIDRDFVVRFSAILHQRKVGRNGRAAAKERHLSPAQIFNILDCARTMFFWGRRPEVGQLPSAFGNPFTEDLVGSRPKKDPLRPTVFPINLRVALVGQMDRWQLCQLGMALVLPLRPEDYTGLLISEVDFDGRQLRFGTRLGGWDFNKGKQTFRVPFPVELEPLLRACVAGRNDGPLLRQRTVVDGRRQPKLQVNSIEDIRECFQRAMAGAKPDVIQAKQDGKRLFRRSLLAMGGVSPDSLAKEFNELAREATVPTGARFYDLRGSVTTDLKDARVDRLIQLYVTGHSLDPEILSRYVSLKLEEDMRGYFRHIRPLLDSIQARTSLLGLV
ncbi:MAG: hypothetical protein NTY19_48545 [Planctomycetota bacterium]|nr:hypothetical protein [Planctomycetota bacterium]